MRAKWPSPKSFPPQAPLSTPTTKASSNTQSYHHHQNLFQEPPPSPPRWNTSLRLLSKHSRFTDALLLYRQMLRSSGIPNAFTFPFVLKSCASLSLPITGSQLHAHVIKSGCGPEPFVLTSLITMYSLCSFIDDARKVFDESPQPKKLTVCYNALISGLSKTSRFDDVINLFCRMRESGVAINSVTVLGLAPVCTLPEHVVFGRLVHGCSVKLGLDTDLSVGNCLLTMYVKCGFIECAENLFHSMSRKCVITWNAMITGCAQNGLASHVLELYKEMKLCGVHPDEVTLVGVLSSCAHLGACSVGCEIEREIYSKGFGSNPYLNNALINMYARCGKLEKARAVFNAMPERSVVSWTAIIGGYGMHGLGEISTQLFDEMIGTGTAPDRAAFVIVLSACSHAGLRDQGLYYFDVMQRIYRMQPGPEHYSCMVDLLGRVGELDKALDLIQSMPAEPDGPVWGALLGACGIHKNVEIAELAFERVIELEPTNIGYYVLLSNIYNETQDLKGVLRIRTIMRERKFKKEPGCSYVECKGKIHLFLAGDTSHPQTEEIYKLLDKLENLVKQTHGYTKNDGVMRSEELSVIMGVHSEKLAIAFGLLHTEPETEIIVIKNLRICNDCHLFIKLASEVTDRRFVVRDATRFHHFSNGLCSCKEYW